MNIKLYFLFDHFINFNIEVRIIYSLIGSINFNFN